MEYLYLLRNNNCCYLDALFLHARAHDLDEGGLLSLAFTVALVTVVLLIKGKRPKDILETIKEKEIPDILVTFILIGATFIGLWLTIRVTGLFAKNYIFHEGYLYTPYEILEILSYILLTRLCFTLFRTFEKIKTYKSPKKLVDTTIQAVLISIITLLPKYEDIDLIFLIGFWGFVFVLLCMAILLVSLTFVRVRIEE